MEKYYTPELDEFHVGFEYEQELNGVWEKDVFEPNKYIDDKQMFDEGYLDDGDIRVKYLDREDIESLGFEFQGSSCYYWYRYYDGEYLLSQATEGSRDELRLTIEKDGDFYFNGIVKNKSELKRALKQIKYVSD